MRTTLEIDDDVLQAVKKIAAKRKLTLGRALSDLARQSITAGESDRVRNGVPLMPRRPKGSAPLTVEMVNRLRDQE
ncbi:MAG: CopG family transcriptional regulator [Acidobacteria bacterium]|nr:CopG family transcriptional regulator [Acidobacteriota bacterium]MBV9071456.1 CopG family transcriptional regulator [Acidobacteriota bacterium]MBV9186549.1 CopG family transcriptional regulator [Acidobacteriota bacterium]